MNYLLFALAALALGPILLHRLRERPALSSALDGFVLVSITGLIFVHFLFPAVEQRDVVVMICLVLGFLLPLALERFARNARADVTRWGLFLGFSGFAVHAALDGAALAAAAVSDSEAPFVLAIVLHRLPEGIAVWWLATTLVGQRTGVAVLLALMGATAGGWSLGFEATHQHRGSELIDFYNAFVGGALVHVAMHPVHGRRDRASVKAQGWGALAALALLAVIVVVPADDTGGGPVSDAVGAGWKQGLTKL